MPRRKERARATPRRQAVTCVRLMADLRRERRRLAAPSLSRLGVAIQHTQESDKLCQLPPALTPQEMADVERWMTRRRSHPGWVIGVDEALPGGWTATTGQGIQAAQDAADSLAWAVIPNSPELQQELATFAYTQNVWGRLAVTFRNGLSKIRRWWE